MTDKYNIPHEDKKSLEALFSNIQLVLHNRSLIYETDEYYNIYISGVGICLAYLNTVPLFLGDLLQLWEQKQWLKEDNYIYFIAGSPSSDDNICHVWINRSGFMQKPVKDLGDLAFPAFSLINYGTIDSKISVKKPTTSKKAGSNLSIFDLINSLKDKN